MKLPRIFLQSVPRGLTCGIGMSAGVERESKEVRQTKGELVFRIEYPKEGGQRVPQR